MPSTGSANFTVTRDAMISASLRTLRILQEGQIANQNQIVTGSEALNMLLKMMQSNGLGIWTYMLLTIPMVANKNTYTIGPVGADIIADRPLRLFEGTFIRQVNGTQSFDTPLRVLSRKDYLQFGSKGSLGVPNSIYYHPGIDLAGGLQTSPSTGFGTLYVYVAPSDATRTIYGNFQRQIYDMTSAGDEFDLPQEWFLPIKWLLAAELLDEYEVPEDRAARIQKKALYYQDKVQGWSVEEAAVQFQPDMMPW